jgi:hypothetical protein
MFLQNLVKKVAFPFSLLLLNPSNVMALDLLEELRNYNPPYSIPEIIIDPNPAPTPIPQPSSPNPSTSNPSPSTTTSNLDDPRFTCEFVNGQYTVLYHPENQTAQGYPWAIPGKMGGGWTPEKRCLEISRRLEAYRPDGLLSLDIGRENNHDILCVTTEVDPSCRIVLTVPPNQNPQITRDLVFENLLVADSGAQTSGINTFNSQNQSSISNRIGNILNSNLRNNHNSSRSQPINLKPFLGVSDGGTGSHLSKESPKPTLKPSSSSILNRLFRK